MCIRDSKEKVLAAARYGLNTIILPRRNEADLDDVAPEVRKTMKFILVDTVDEVLAAALTGPGEYDGSGNGPVSKQELKASKPVVKKKRKQKVAAD